jgi:hypothetical protein
MGTLFTIVTYNEDFEIQETFINIGKTGAETHAVAEALGRIISIFLRHDCIHSAGKRLEAVIDQLSGIGSVSHGEVTSMPDSVAKALREAKSEVERKKEDANGEKESGHAEDEQLGCQGIPHSQT